MCCIHPTVRLSGVVYNARARILYIYYSSHFSNESHVTTIVNRHMSHPIRSLIVMRCILSVQAVAISARLTVLASPLSPLSTLGLAKLNRLYPDPPSSPVSNLNSDPRIAESPRPSCAAHSALSGERLNVKGITIRRGSAGSAIQLCSQRPGP